MKDEEQRRFSKGKGFRFKIGFIELEFLSKSCQHHAPLAISIVEMKRKEKTLVSSCPFAEETDDSRSNSRMDPTTRGALGYSKPDRSDGEGKPAITWRGEDARAAGGRGRGRENVWRVSRHLRGGGEEYSWNFRMARRVCVYLSLSQCSSVTRRVQLIVTHRR